MEKKIYALKTSSKIISIIAKICYNVMIVAFAICSVLLILMAVTGGRTSSFMIGGTNVIIFDAIASTPTEITSVCAVLIALCGFLFAIFLFVYRMFNEISMTGDPFTQKHVNAVRVIGILIAAMPIVLGIVECIISFFSKTEIPELFTELPGIVIGAVIFCLSYIIDYGCELQKQSKTDNIGEKIDC